MTYSRCVLAHRDKAYHARMIDSVVRFCAPCLLLLSSCVLSPPPKIETPTGQTTQLTGTLREANGRYELNRPLQDFYDTVLVQTRAGKSAPRLVTVAEAAETLAPVVERLTGT